MQHPSEGDLPEAHGENRPPHSFYGSIFADANGVRPIWRVLTYFVAFYLLRSLLLVALVAAAPTSADTVTSWWLFLAEICLRLIAAVAPAWFLAKLESKTLGNFGLPRRGAFGKQFWSGALWGLAAITILLLAMHALGIFDFGHFAGHRIRVAKFAAFWAVFFLAVGLYEDFLFRGYSLITLSEAIGFWPSAALMSIIFGSLHLQNSGETVTGALGAASVGLFFCLTLRRTGSLWFAIGMHASWDWGESFLYSVPDSGQMVPGHLLSSSSSHGPRWLTGGSVGPEGSVLVFVLIVLMWVVFDRLYPARKS